MVSLPSALTLSGTCPARAVSAATFASSGFGSGTSDASPGVHAAPVPPPSCSAGFSVVAPQPAANRVAAAHSTVNTDRRVRDTSSLLESLTHGQSAANPAIWDG